MHGRASKLKGGGSGERRLEVIGQGSLVAREVGNDHDDDDDYEFDRDYLAREM